MPEGSLELLAWYDCVDLDCMNILGGPEIYSVASKAFTAGLPGKRTAKIWEVKLAVSGAVDFLC